MKSFRRLISHLLLCLFVVPVLTLAAKASVAPVSGTQAFAALACKYTSHPDPLALIGAFDDIFGVAGGGPGAPNTVDHYWREVSGGTVDLAGSKALGWFDLPKSWADYGNDADWQRTLPDDCIAAAMAGDPTFDPHAFAGLVIIVNHFFPVHPGVGEPQPAYANPQLTSLTLPDGTSGDWRLLQLSKPSALQMSSYTHEIGHTFGFRHSRRPSGLDYGNPWDLMSSGSCPGSDDACVDVHPIAYHKATVDWLPTARRRRVSQHGTFSTDLLVHTDIPDHSVVGDLLIEVDTGIPNRIITIESRVADASTYDGLLPDSGVILHRIDKPYTPSPHTRLLADMKPPPDEFAVDVDSSVYTVGERYSESIGPIGTLTVRVDSALGPALGPATGYRINVTLTPPPPFAGCGPGAQGQISQSECEALVSLANLAVQAPVHFANTALPCSWVGVFCLDVDGDGGLEVTELDMATIGDWEITFGAGDTAFQDLPHLRLLNMHSSGIDGEMPDSVYGLADLEELYAQGFDGPISPQIGNLTKLQWLGFHRAQFVGTLPPEIGQLASLNQIYVNRMPNITGILPPELADIGPVRYMFFNGSDLCVPNDADLIAWLNSAASVSPDPPDWVYCRETDIVFVLDDTASMQQQTGDGSGNTKIESLRNAIGMFTAILGYRRAERGDTVGAVSFKVPPVGPRPVGFCAPSWSHELVAMADLDATLPSIDAAADGLPADGGATPLRAGIEAGGALLAAGAPDRRRLMILVTDGKQNTPGCFIGPPHNSESVATFRQTHITDNDIELIAVGLGSGPEVDAALLGDLATDGYFDSATSTIELNKWFTQALSIALGDTVLLDPEGTLAPGQSDTHGVEISGETRSVTFILSWARADTDLALSLRAPDGTVIGLSQARNPQNGVRFLSGPTFRAAVLETPLGGDLAGLGVAGGWTAVIDHLASSQSADAPYQLAVLADSGLRMETGFAAGPVTTGGRLQIRAALPDIKEATVVAHVDEPRIGVGSLFADLGLSDEDVRRQTADMAADTDLIRRRIRLLQDQDKTWPIETQTREVALFDDGRHDDGEAGDGVYGGVLEPVTVDGHYSVLIRADGTTMSGRTFQREFRRGVFARVGVSDLGSGLEIDRGEEGTRLVVTPRDAAGLLLGPGFADAIAASTADGTVSAVTDLGDGTYAVQVELASDREDGLVEISAFGKRLQAVVLTAPPPASRWPWIVAAVLAALVIVVALFRRRRSTP